MSEAYVADDGFLLTDEVLDGLAAEYEDGSWEGHGKVGPGRPRMYDEDMETVSFRLPKSRIFAIGAVAKSQGESKSEFIRKAIDAALLAHA